MCQTSFQRKLLKKSKMSFYDVLSKKIIKEILIRNNFHMSNKYPLKEINRGNFDKKEFYVSNIKLVWICIFDTKTCVHLISFINIFLTWLLSPCNTVSENHSFLCKVLTKIFNYKICTDDKSPYFVEKNDIYQIKNIFVCISSHTRIFRIILWAGDFSKSHRKLDFNEFVQNSLSRDTWLFLTLMVMEAVKLDFCTVSNSVVRKYVKKFVRKSQ